MFYPISGQLVDKYGTIMLSVGAVGQAIAGWWWYLSFENYESVLLSIILLNSSGSLGACCLLRIANQWFGEKERALAVAIASFISTLGSAAALLVGPMFSTGDKVINFELRSCEISFQNSFNVTGDVDSLACSPAAEESFCCAAPTNIDAYNLFNAFCITVVAIFTVIVVSNLPFVEICLGSRPSPNPSKLGRSGSCWPNRKNCNDSHVHEKKLQPNLPS